MGKYHRASKEEIDEWEATGELLVCPVCDYHAHVDSVGDDCPACGEKMENC